MKTLCFLACLLAAPVAAGVPIVDATYQVPTVTGMDELAPIKEISFDGKAGARRLRFRLPDDLSGGMPTFIEFKEAPSSQHSLFTIFVGDASDEAASCLLTPHSGHCLVHYLTPSVTSKVLTTYLRNKFKDDATYHRKLTVALSYANEPAGVLSLNFGP